MYFLRELFLFLIYMKKHIRIIGAFALVLSASVLTACSREEVAQVVETVVPTVLAQNADFTYETFSDERYAELKGNEPFAVFAHSKSCGTCAKKNKEILDEVEDFTTGTILKMEYGEADSEFLQTYGITNYDTFVTFDASGNHTTTPGAEVDTVREKIGNKNMEQTQTTTERIMSAIVPTVYAQTETFTYKAYDEKTFTELRGSEPFTVFVHSNSCGTCAKKDKQIIDSASEFEGGTVLKMEFSEAPAAFRQEFNVTNYDTFVKFDQGGNAVTVPGASISSVKAHLN
jgi:bacterioferritin-associated ferredoxin